MTPSATIWTRCTRAAVLPATLARRGSTHRESYRDIVFVGMVGPIISLAAIIVLGTFFGSL